MVELGTKGAFTSLLNKQLLPLIDKINSLESEIIIARVTDIVLDSSHEKFKDVGEYNGIGTIFWETVDITTSKDNKAKPFHSNITTPPLINELVLLFNLPNIAIGGDPTQKSYYYSNIISLWNSPHCNPFPNLQLNSSSPPGDNKSLSQTQLGSPNNTSTTIPPVQLNSFRDDLNSTFIERSNINPLQPYMGDVIYEGRWGNSIRFGSTAAPANKEWSSEGKNGDPITLIRNGQNPNLPSTSFTTTVENITRDLSSIYLTSTQKVPIFTQNSSFFSYPKELKPSTPNTYTGPQVIINSNRLIFNAKEDHVLISGQKSVNLSSNNSLNFDAKHFLIDSGNIRLGSKDAKESIVKGDTLLFHLDSILKALIQMTAIMSTSQIYPNGVPKADIEKNNAYSNINTTLGLIQEDLESILSKNVKTI
jgi:hypothetical protein